MLGKKRGYERFAPGQVVVTADGLCQTRLAKRAYQDVTLRIKQGECFAICGKNRSGKTELLLTITGHMMFTKGKLNVLGYDLPMGGRHVQRRCGLGFFYGLNDVKEKLSVASAIAAELQLYGIRGSKENVRGYLTEWGLINLADKKAESLTAFERMKLGIALACVGDPEIIVVDDLESGLTHNQILKIVGLMNTIAHVRGITVVFTCDEVYLAELADGHYLMNGGDGLDEAPEPRNYVDRIEQEITDRWSKHVPAKAGAAGAGAGAAGVAGAAGSPSPAKPVTPVVPESEVR